MEVIAPTRPQRLRELAGLFLRLGTIAFGGPAAHIALMRREVAQRRRWVSDQEFLDLVGACNLIPGPNSTELAIHLGRTRAGWRGLVVAGTCFILPATAIVLALAALYEQTRDVPEVRWVLYGVLPVIVAVVAQAIAGLLRTAVKGAVTAAIGVAALALSLAGVNELIVLFGGGALGLLLGGGGGGPWRARAAALLAALGLGSGGTAAAATAAGGSLSLGSLFLSMLKIGAVLYGSGYVILAFFEGEFVDRLGVLTNQELLDAVAVGQVTPGPVFTTATFVGYLIGGVPGALLATVAIFLPGFVFVALSAPYVARMRSSARASAFLDGINVAALALMAAVTVRIGGDAIVDVLTALLAVAALAALLRLDVGSAWLILAGGAIGLAAQASGIV